VPYPIDPKHYNALHRDVVDARLSVVRNQRALDRAANQFVGNLTKKWKREIERLQRQSRTPTREFLVKRRALIMRRLQAITDAEVKRMEAWLGDKVQDAGRKAAVTAVQQLEKAVLRAPVGTGVGFIDLDMKAVRGALAAGVPGAALTQSFRGISQGAMARMRRDVTRAVAEGASIDDLVNKWEARGGTSRFFKHDVRSLARTSTLAASNTAALATYEQNSNVVEGVQWEATFDTRTSMGCMALHGRKYTHDEPKPPMPRHLNCRCTWLPKMTGVDTSDVDDLTAYRKPNGTTGYKKKARDAEAWVRRQPVGRQRDFFQSELKRRAFRDRRLRLDQMIRPDGTNLDDAEIIRLIRDPKWLKSNVPPTVTNKAKAELSRVLRDAAAPARRATSKTLIDQPTPLPRMPKTKGPVSATSKAQAEALKRPDLQRVVEAAKAQGAKTVEQVVAVAQQNGISELAEIITVVRAVVKGQVRNRTIKRIVAGPGNEGVTA
jgi:SPP1 gp7 family putative phage head morphogenesis protein